MQRNGSNTQSIYNAVWSCIKNKRFKDALIQLKNINDTLRNDAWYDAHARCMLETHQHNDALTSLSKMKKQTKSSLICYARCYQIIGEYDLAIEKYHQIYGWNSNTQVLFYLARCYQEMHQYDNAIIKLHEILPYDKNLALIALGRCYQEMGLYDEGIENYQQIEGYAYNKLALLGLARCYQAKGNYDEAIKIFQDIIKISNCKLDNEALLGIAHCYQEAGRYDQAIEHYQQNPDWFKRKDILLGLARCYQAKGDHEKAHASYTTVLNQFPNYQDAAYHFGHYLIEQQCDNAGYFIEAALHEFPASGKLHLLKSYYLYQQNDLDAAISTLKNLFGMKPYEADAYLELIRYYLIKGEIEIAVEYGKYCHNTFKGYHKLFSSIEKIKIEIDKINAQRISIDVTREMHPLHTNQAVDHTNLLALNPLIQQNQLANSFTITSLYVNKEQLILDVSGVGLSDYKNHILRTIGDPVQCLQKDPACLLEAIKYIALGFQPTKELVHALSTWTPKQDLEFAYLHTIMRKDLSLLSTQQQMLYVRQLQKFNLIDKIFNICTSSTNQSMLITLIENIQNKNVPLPNNQQIYEEQKQIESYLCQHSMFGRYVNPNGPHRKCANPKTLAALDLAQPEHVVKLK